MTIKSKKKTLLATGLGCVISLATAFSVGYTVNADTAGYIKHGPGSVEVKVENGNYTFTGSMGRERAGYVISTPINHRYELSFDYTLLVDGEGITKDPQTRAYVITLNENVDAEDPYYGNNTHIPSSINGLQLEIRTNPWNNGGELYINAMAHGTRIYEKNSTFTWQDGKAHGELPYNSKNELYKYLCSAFFQKEVNGVTAEEAVNVRFYPSNANGEKVTDGSDTHYTFALTPYVAGELYTQSLYVTANKNNISDKGDFTTTPNLGFFLLNEATPDKVIDVEVGMSNINNGRVRSVTANYKEIPALKHGEPVQLEVTMKPHKADDTLADVTYTYKSLNENIVTVSETGLVTAVAQRGGTSILVTTSEGNTVNIPVRIFDDVAPEITLNDDVVFPETVTQYDEVIIPNFTATDDSDEVERSLELVAPKGKVFDLSQDTLSFSPTNAGDYIIEYRAVDPSGNKTVLTKTVKVNPATPLEDWVKYESFHASAKLVENADNSVHFSGEVGQMADRTGHEAVAWYNNPILFTKLDDGSYTTVEFSYKINYSLGTPIVGGNATERERYFGMYLVESTADNSVGAERFAWNTPGIQIIVGKRDTVQSDALVWYDLRSGTSLISRQHTTVIDAGATATDEEKKNAKSQRDGAYSKGAECMPWFEDGDARNFATKFSKGEEIKVKIEYVDQDTPGYDPTWKENYFILTMDEWSFRISADAIAGSETGFTRQAYLGFKQYSDNGVIPFDVEISKITNGTIRKVGFENGNSSVNKLGDEFVLNAKSYDNDGNVVEDTFSYVSGNEKIASVDENGKVKINAIGSTKIVVTSKSTGKVGIYTINVDIESFSIVEKEIVMYLGQDKQLELTVVPGVDVPFVYTSANPRIVAALNTGMLQAVKLGETTVTVSYFGHEETCTIRVVTKEEYLAMNNTSDDSSSSSVSGTPVASCNASVTGVVGCLALACVTLGIAKFSKRKED